MFDNSGMKNNRNQVKKHHLCGETSPTISRGPTRSSPGIKCPESLYSRVTNLSEQGAPCHFMHGTQWTSIPNMLHVGLSCRSEDAPKGKGRQVIHGRPYLPADGRIQSGLLMESEALTMVGLKNLLRDNILVRRPASDVVLTSGINGRIPPGRIVQLIGIKPSIVQCRYDRVGQV
eukprot:8810000-Pyramimonas_sp.AAC.1